MQDKCVFAFGVALFALAAPLQANIIITPVFESSITSDPNAAAIEANITDAIDFYENTITTPISIKIAFGEMGSGLGQSTTYTSTISYLTYITDLHAVSSGDATDATALAGLPITSTNPVNSGSEITLKTANYAAIGGPVNPAGLTDPCGSGQTGVYGCIQLNTSLTTPPNSPSGSVYSLLAVTEHEMDEVLGLGSGLGCAGGAGVDCTAGTPAPEDLFRYTAGGARSYSLNADTTGTCSSSPAAYFSLNGTDDLAQFNNCNNGGDYGDWAAGVASAKVQDAFGTPGASPALSLSSPEIVGLDAVGYNIVSSVPEPVSLLLVAPVLALIMRRRRS